MDNIYWLWKLYIYLEDSIYRWGPNILFLVFINQIFLLRYIIKY